MWKASCAAIFRQSRVAKMLFVPFCSLLARGLADHFDSGPTRSSFPLPGFVREAFRSDREPIARPDWRCCRLSAYPSLAENFEVHSRSWPPPWRWLNTCKASNRVRHTGVVGRQMPCAEIHQFHRDSAVRQVDVEAIRATPLAFEPRRFHRVLTRRIGRVVPLTFPADAPSPVKLLKGPKNHRPTRIAILWLPFNAHRMFHLRTFFLSQLYVDAV